MKKTAIFQSAALALFMYSHSAQADQVILDDLIVDGSLCVGFDCVNGESFGFDTIRLKENNTRIRFYDTSNSASFPTNDWQLTANDSSNGGQNKFSIDDIDGGRTPFTIEAGAPSHSLYADDYGRIGFGTSAPVVELHVKDGDTPTLRLEQDGSSGFTAQTWDLAGNESNFFIRDVTNGSQLPFRIQPGADSNTLYLSSSNYVGIGTSSPGAELHILETDTDAIVKVEANGATKVQLVNNSTTKEWKLTNSQVNTFRIVDEISSGDTNEFELDADGNLTIAGNIITAGSCSGGCDLVFHPDTVIDTIEEHAHKMWSNNYLPAVGPTKENGPFNLSLKTGGMLNELEKAHIYIEQLNNKIKDKDNEIVEMKTRLTKLEDKLNQLIKQ